MKDEQIEILVEEPSMKNFLNGILPKILPEGYQLNQNCFIREHQGKQHLKKCIPIKLRAYEHLKKQVKVIIIHDQDTSDCKALKSELQDLSKSTSSIPTLVRIACKELEAWYLGDMDAIESIYPQFKANKFRNRALFSKDQIMVLSDILLVTASLRAIRWRLNVYPESPLLKFHYSYLPFYFRYLFIKNIHLRD